METLLIKFLRFLLIGFYAFAGSYHFINPEFYLDLIPDYLPYPQAVNYISGFLEIVLAIGVAIPKTRLLAVKGIIVLLIVFIPSHVYFIQIGSCVDSAFCVAPWIAWVRLLLVHPLLIWWAWAVRK
ncbi:MAG: DoxX family protein [Winogradskyella sp.]|uniref:DoxX family protein n=1 Tax=Winogradskyella sp. TaxID=1883156 RepID=UPI00385AD9F7